MPFKNLLPVKLNIDRTIGPINAAKGLFTLKPSIKDATNQKRNALRTRENSPTVRSVMGKVSMNKIGLITVFTNPRISATTNAI